MPVTQKTPCGLAWDAIDLVLPWIEGTLPVVFHHGIGTDRHV
jgi:hypothetical protein